jgi:FixJ family two-component response regulator
LIAAFEWFTIQGPKRIMKSTQTHPTVFVVDDDPSVRKGLARLLKSACYAVECFASAREFLDRISHGERAGCVVLDVRMPGLSGLELQRELKAFTPPISIIFLTGHGDIPMGVRAMKDGATDFLVKPIHDEDLLLAVQQAIARNAEDRVSYEVLRELQLRAGALTPRELEVMTLVVRGRLNKQVAGELGTVEKTIKVHRARVMEKMKVTSLAELVVAAEKLGILRNQTMPAVFPPPDARSSGWRALPPPA